MHYAAWLLNSRLGSWNRFPASYRDSSIRLCRERILFGSFPRWPLPPLNVVMVHGLGAGLAMFAMNFGALSRGGPVYALRSSRPHFSADPLLAEEEYVQCIENWRHSLGLDKIHLLGTYSTCYTAKTQYQKFETNIPRKGTARLGPNYYIQVSVSDLFIPLISLPILLQENTLAERGNILHV
jgi:hypothetical protein